MQNPNLTFNGQTYVAFSDLCGFKTMMKNRDDAYNALDVLFRFTYELSEQNKNVQAIAVSDCVISWAIDGQLQSMIEFTSGLHKKMIERRFLMQTAIAFGEFRYERRIELPNLQKGMMVGGAYLSAYVEHHNVAEGGIVLFKGIDGSDEKPEYRADLWERSQKPRGWEYFWSASDSSRIRRIKTERRKADNAKYERLKDIYQETGTQQHELWQEAE